MSKYLKNAGESELAAKVRELIGVGPEEPVEISLCPHMKRPDGRENIPIPNPPDRLSFFESLREAPEWVLEHYGLQRWGEHGLWLFPVEWFDYIPKGFEVMNIFGEVGPFDPDDFVKEARFGALPFGIPRPELNEEKDASEKSEDKTADTARN